MDFTKGRKNYRMQIDSKVVKRKIFIHFSSKMLCKKEKVEEKEKTKMSAECRIILEWMKTVKLCNSKDN